MDCSKLIFLFLLPGLLLSSFYNFGQAVKNDSIKYTEELKVNSPFLHSSTKNCTVEWNCVDKKGLQGSITFHNDQWFVFKTNQAGDYFLNIKDQICRDLRGVQVLVIAGVPCQPQTYKYLKLHSQLSLEDIYYKLEGLPENSTYLISVDGMLGDFCDFDIAISDTPPEYALLKPDFSSKAEMGKVGELVYLEWEITKEIYRNSEAFLIYRKLNNEKAVLVKEIPLTHTTIGDEVLRYNFTDSLISFGDFSYRIVLKSSEGKNYLIKDLTFLHFPQGQPNETKIFSYTSPYKGSGELRFQILDLFTGKVLTTVLLKNEKHKKYQLDFSRQVRLGTRNFKINVFYENSPDAREQFEFRVK